MTPAEKATVESTHFADNVLMEPVMSMSPARNSWYLVQAMLDVWTGQTHQVTSTTEYVSVHKDPGCCSLSALLCPYTPHDNSESADRWAKHTLPSNAAEIA